MEGAVLTTANNNGFRSHLKNAASAFCARTLPKQRRKGAPTVVIHTAKHHTYPRVTTSKRAAITCHLESPQTATQGHVENIDEATLPGESTSFPATSNGTIKLRGALAREVASAWECRIGASEQSAPADRIQSLFNDIELYPTKTQVFEMLVCARQCARRKSLTLTFGEFCVFAAELRRCSRQLRQTPNKIDSPQWSVDVKEVQDKDSTSKHVNGSEATPPPCEVFLGGSCNPTTWRSDIAIPMLQKMGITYFNPQVDTWSSELMEVEHRAKAAARALLFVLDSETRAVAASVEAAHLAAAPRDLLLVLRPYSRNQAIGEEIISDHEYLELSRARATLQEAVERRGLPAFTDIPSALRCARAVLRGARTHPRQSLGHTIVRLKRAFDAAGAKATQLPRCQAIQALCDYTKASKFQVENCLPVGVEKVDFETFCAAVAELASGTDVQVRNGLCNLEASSDTCADAAGRTETPQDGNGLKIYNARLRAYGRKLGLFIPKNGGNKTSDSASAAASASGGDTGDSVLTPGTELRLQELPAMLSTSAPHVYLAGSFPNGRRPEDILRRENITYISGRANDYTRMFSAPARRTAPAHPDSPRADKKPRPDKEYLHDSGVQLREKAEGPIDANDRLSASDFYTVSEDSTPQPFKGTYDEDLLLGSKMLVFSMNERSPCFGTMVLAAHYMGLRPRETVLLVQPLDPRLATSYSALAVQDYNRGRHYLKDLAGRTGVPVFDNLDDTMAYVIGKLRTSHT